MSIIGSVNRKTLVLDLDETLIHSHHDGVMRQTVKPGTPPDFVLRVSLESLYSAKVEYWSCLLLLALSDSNLSGTHVELEFTPHLFARVKSN